MTMGDLEQIVLSYILHLIFVCHALSNLLRPLLKCMLLLLVLVYVVFSLFLHVMKYRITCLIAIILVAGHHCC